MSVEICFTKSSCCLGRFRLMTMRFKPSTKNKWLMVVSRLTERPTWNPFHFFDKNDKVFTEGINNNTERASLWKIPRR